MERALFWASLALAALFYGGFEREDVRRKYRLVRLKYRLLVRGIHDLLGSRRA
ncbi:MAG: hypothetical protein QM758_13465 [Armatimonas sp.]